jgi:pilus assembly protein CpaC
MTMKNNQANTSSSRLGALTLLAAASLMSAAAFAATPAKPAAAASAPVVPEAPITVKIPPSTGPQNTQYSGPTEVGAPLQLTVGKTALVRLPADASRLSIGNPEVADVMLINPREVYLLGRKFGSTNLFVWTKNGRTTLIDISVGLDTGTLKSRLNEMVPSETGLAVGSLGDAVVLSGHVSDPMKAQRLVSLAEAYGGGKKVVNLLVVDGSQQIMLEVKVAEVSKTLLDKLGVEFNLTRGGTNTYRLITSLLTGSSSMLTGVSANGRTAIALDAEVKNGLVKILAEPTIMAMSGQEGAFLAGGKIYIPVPQSGTGGNTTITLEEKEFGVGLRFIPTLLEDGLINLRVTPEVSELSQVGTPITSISGQTSILPTIITRRASTTVQLHDGESFAIGGLIKSNVTEAVKALPGLGELPVLGALFRSNEFQTDRSELLFIVTPRLVKPLPPNYALPTDGFIEPTRGQFMLNGRMEGDNSMRPAPAPQPAAPAQPGGFQLK